MKSRLQFFNAACLGLALVFVASAAFAQGSLGQGILAPAAPVGNAFTYQGKLTDGGAPANGVYDFRFGLYDDLNAGNQVGGALTRDDVTVADGLFTVELDFGAVFDGTALFLDVGVRPGADSGAYTPLTPRQALTGTPYALYALKAPWAGLTGVPAGFADGVDDGSAYTAGSGLALNGSQFSVTGAPWTGLTGVPAGFADGVDDGSAYTAGSGLALNGSQFSVTGAPWAGLTAVPAGFADGVDDNTTYTAGDGLLLNGTQFQGQGTSYENVVIVAKSGGDYTTIGAALASITTNSADNRYLVWVAPGTYTETITMKEYVDIEGAGELATRITYTGSASDNTGTVVGTDNAELRFLMVENSGNDSYAIAIYNNSTSPRLTHLTVIGKGATNYASGVYNFSASPMMTDMIVSAEGGSAATGVLNNSSASPVMKNISATTSGGIYNYGIRNYVNSSPLMMNVTAAATSAGLTYNYGVRNESNSSPTMINVTATASGGVNNDGVNNDSSSPTMTNVIAIASGGTGSNYGVRNYYGSSPVMTGVTITASGGTNSYGMYNYSSAPVINQVVISATGGTNVYGMYINTSSPTIQNSAISASGGSNNYGLYHSAASGAYTVMVNNSQISGSTYTVRNDAEFTTRIGATRLDGGAVTPNGGVVTCVFVFDEAYVGYANTCP